MIEALLLSLTCSGISLFLGVCFWLQLKERQKRQKKKEEAEKRILEETRLATQDPEILRGIEELSKKNKL